MDFEGRESSREPDVLGEIVLGKEGNVKVFVPSRGFVRDWVGKCKRNVRCRY